MKNYDFKAAKKAIQLKSDLLDSATLGIFEDWFWTAQTVFEDGVFEINLDEVKKIAGIGGSSWGTPRLMLNYKDGREEMVDMYTKDGEQCDKPEWLELGCLSGPCQEYIDGVNTPKLEAK